MKRHKQKKKKTIRKPNLQAYLKTREARDERYMHTILVPYLVRLLDKAQRKTSTELHIDSAGATTVEFGDGMDPRSYAVLECALRKPLLNHPYSLYFHTHFRELLELLDVLDMLDGAGMELGDIYPTAAPAKETTEADRVWSSLHSS